MFPYFSPGVYVEDVAPPRAIGLRTGVPAFLGYAGEAQAGLAPLNTPLSLTLWSQYAERFAAAPNSYLAFAVRGFFDNGGRVCYVVRLNETANPVDALGQALQALTAEEGLDLLCAPDIMRPSPGSGGALAPPPVEQVRTLQSALLEHCDALDNRFAILDSLPGAGSAQVLAQRSGLAGTNGALYYPWIRVGDGPAWSGGLVPPCGHVAGVYAATDDRVGVFKAPANEALTNVLDLEVNLSDVDQGQLNPEGVNCLRAFPGRGIRVWGARTLSRDNEWTYVSVRRLFLTLARWLRSNLSSASFEPNDSQLWSRIERELTAYMNDLFRRGALRGNTPQEAFFVRCNADTNPPEIRETGAVVAEIGLAAAAPSEFVIVRIVQSVSGVTLVGPAGPG